MTGTDSDRTGATGHGRTDHRATNPEPVGGHRLPGTEEAPWRNWSGRHVAAGSVHHARSEADVAALAVTSAAAGATVRATGAGHSHQPLVPNDHLIVDVSGLSGVIATETAGAGPEGGGRARIWAGTAIHALGRPLHDAGLALLNQGDIDRQTIAGAVATGTHGTGAGLRSLSAAVVGARLALATGELVDCSADVEPDLWRAARLNLGALGIVTRLDLEVRSAYRLAERGFVAPLDDALAELGDLAARHRHVELFWFPVADRAIVKVADETAADPEYPLGQEGSRVAWNYEVLPNHRTWLHTEMEYAVPAADGPACLGAIADLLRRGHPTMAWPIEYRFVAADDVWLSPANGRPTVAISLHQGIEVDDEPLFREAEEVFRSFTGRPHWGKVHYLGGDDLAAVHPDWNAWWAVRDSVDPGGVFLNPHLGALRR